MPVFEKHHIKYRVELTNLQQARNPLQGASPRNNRGRSESVAAGEDHENARQVVPARIVQAAEVEQDRCRVLIGNES